MSGGYDRLSNDELERLLSRMDGMQRRLDELERPSGMQMLGTTTRDFPTATIPETSSTVQQFTSNTFDISIQLPRDMRVMVVGRALLSGQTTVTSSAAGRIYGSIAVYPNGQVVGDLSDWSEFQLSALGGSGLSTTLTFDRSLNISHVMDLAAGSHTFTASGSIQRAGTSGVISLSNFAYSVTRLGSPV